MTTEELQQRIAAITNEMAQLRATYSKLEGHLAEAQYWLTEKLKPAVEHIQELAKEGEQENGEIEQQN